MMPNKWQISSLVAVALMSFTVALYFGNGTTSTIVIEGTFSSIQISLMDLLRAFSAAITATTIALTLFHLGLWRYLPKAIAPRPDINGTWRVLAEPWSRDKIRSSPFEGYMFVKQNYFTLSMRLETETACSELEAEKFNITKGELYELWAIYFCEPRAGVFSKDVLSHYGAMKLNYVEIGDQVRLEGRFWIDGIYYGKENNPVEGGKLILHDRKKKIYHSYESAKAAYDIASLSSSAYPSVRQ